MWHSICSPMVNRDRYLLRNENADKSGRPSSLYTYFLIDEKKMRPVSSIILECILIIENTYIPASGLWHLELAMN